MIKHPMVVESECTCAGCPDQWEGTLTDGRYFYLRYRCGWVSLGVGDALNTAIDDGIFGGVGRALGDSLQGIFDSAEQRDEIFAELLAQRLAAA